jgi:hypothetical protein
MQAPPFRQVCFEATPPALPPQPQILAAWYQAPKCAKVSYPCGFLPNGIAETCSLGVQVFSLALSWRFHWLRATITHPVAHYQKIRRALTKALSADGNSEFATVLGVLAAMDSNSEMRVARSDSSFVFLIYDKL